MKHDLRDALTIAKVDEDHASVIAPAMHPAHQDYGLAFVGQAQGAARIGTAQIT